MSKKQTAVESLKNYKKNTKNVGADGFSFCELQIWIILVKIVGTIAITHKVNVIFAASKVGAVRKIGLEMVAMVPLVEKTLTFVF